MPVNASQECLPSGDLAAFGALGAAASHSGAYGSSQLGRNKGEQLTQVLPSNWRGEQSSLTNAGGRNKGYFPAAKSEHHIVPASELSGAPHVVVNINTTNNFGSSNFGQAPEDPSGSMLLNVGDLLNANLPYHLSKSSASVGRADQANRHQINEDSNEEYGRAEMVGGDRLTPFIDYS